MDVLHHGRAVVRLAALRLRVDKVQDHPNHTQEEAQDQTREGTLQAGAGRQRDTRAMGWPAQASGTSANPHEELVFPGTVPARVSDSRRVGATSLFISHIQLIDYL